MSDIRRNDAESRYEVWLDGELAGIAAFHIQDGRVVFTHTKVEERFEGRGVGSALARYALDDVRAGGGARVVPRCPFIREYIQRHAEYADLLATQA